MSRNLRTAVIVASAMLVIFTGFWIGGVRSELRSVEPSFNRLINFTAFPTEGGPYITGATYWPNSGGGGLGGPMSELVIVFNEPVDPATVQLSDFEPLTFDFTGSSLIVNGSVVTIFGPFVNFTDDGVEMFKLADVDVISGFDGHGSRHVSEITIGRGPIMTSVDLLDVANQDPDDDVLRIMFDHDIDQTTVTGADFAQIEEFELATDLTLAFPMANVVDISLGTGGFGQMRAGITKAVLATGAIEWADPNGGIPNDRPQSRVSSNEGPKLKAAYWNVLGAEDADDELWLVFDEQVDPTSYLGRFFADFFTAVNWGPVAGGDGGLSSAFPGFFSSVIKVTALNVTGAGVPSEGTGGAITLNAPGAFSIDDYQGVAHVQTATPVLIGKGVGIIRASYDDQQNTSPGDDALYLWLNELVETPGNIDIGDFEADGFSLTGTSIGYSELAGDVSRITVTGFTSRIPTGSQIRGAAGNDIIGSQSGAPYNLGELQYITIVDESVPYEIALTADDALTFGAWDGVNMWDVVHLGWDEAGQDDSDQYLLWVRKEPFPEGEPEDNLLWAEDNIGGAVPVGNLRSLMLDSDNQIGLIIDPNHNGPAGIFPYIRRTSDSDLDNIVIHDELYFLLAPADWTGNTVHPDGGLTFGPFFVGPVPPPRDWCNGDSAFAYGDPVSFPTEDDWEKWDSDLIHVYGEVTDTETGAVEFFVLGDPNTTVPGQADTVEIYTLAAGGLPDGDLLAVAEVDAEGGFGPVSIGMKPILLPGGSADDPSTWAHSLYIFAKSNGILSVDPDENPAAEPYAYAYTHGWRDVVFGFDPPGGIPLHQHDPRLVAGTIFDPWNPYRTYKEGDYVNIRLQGAVGNDQDGDGVPDEMAPPVLGAPISALLNVWGDFTLVDETTETIEAFGSEADSIWFVSMGADAVDNNRNWTVAEDAGLDGVFAVDDADGSQDDGVPTFGEPFVDENGNGAYNQGESFLNLTSREGQSYYFDPGEPGLDCQDPEERGWYEIRSLDADDCDEFNDVVEKVAGATFPPEEGVGVCGTVSQGYVIQDPTEPIPGEDPSPPIPVALHLKDDGTSGNSWLIDMWPSVDNLSPEQYGMFPGTDPTRRFIVELDAVAPTVVKFTELYSVDPDENILDWGDPPYALGAVADFVIETPSDNDVLCVEMEISTDSGATWQPLGLDFLPGRDAGSDGMPGLEEVDEDGDGFTDEDDPEVINAQESSFDDEFGVNAENDLIDNDNDAHFVYDPYNNTIVWWNIDETRESPSGNDGLDDDNDGEIDEEDEATEADSYMPEYDNNEDGIMTGEKVEIILDGMTSYLGRDSSGVAHGEYPFSIWVDRSHVVGLRQTLATSDRLGLFYGNGVAYVEPVLEGFDVLYAFDRPGPRTGLPPWGTGAFGVFDNDEADSSAANRFQWTERIEGSPSPGAPPGDPGDPLSMEFIADLYELTADGETPYMLRGVGYDKGGNVNSDYSVPITFTLDFEGPTVYIGDSLGACSPPEDFGPDVDPSTDVHDIWDAGKHPDTYPLTATAEGDAAEVSFFWRSRRWTLDGLWELIRTDMSEPFTTEWPLGLTDPDSMFFVDNYPADHVDSVYFAATAEDAWGNGSGEFACSLMVVVKDGTPPSTWITQIADDTDPGDGTTVVVRDSSIIIKAMYADNDDLYWVGGLDMRPGDRNVDDDGDLPYNVVDGYPHYGVNTLAGAQDVAAYDTDGIPNDEICYYLSGPVGDPAYLPDGSDFLRLPDYDKWTMLSCDNDGNLFSVDLGTGAASFVCALPSGGTEIEFNNLNSRAILQYPDGAFQHQEIDVNSCAPLGPPVFNGFAFSGLEYVGSTLYGTGHSDAGAPSSLYIIDPSTGATTLIGPTGFGPISGLTYDPGTATMYGITGGLQPSDLVTIDLGTGAATVVGNTGIISFGGLAFGPSGQLYGIGNDFEGGNLYSIDPGTGFATLVGVGGMGGMTGLTLASFDVLAGAGEDEWGTPTSDDYITNDVIHTVFEYRAIPGGDWIEIATVTGDVLIQDGDTLTVDFTQPVAVTWNTYGLDGTYQVKAWSCDIEGNCDTETAPIYVVSVMEAGLRAYIQPIPSDELPPAVDLYAIHHIHDFEIRSVEFQYYFDRNGDGCWDTTAVGPDSSTWHTIDFVDDPKGDMVLYKGDTDIYELGTVLGDFGFKGNPGTYLYADRDGDGYSPRDPVVRDYGDLGVYDSENDELILGDPDDVPEGFELSEFERMTVIPLGGEPPSIPVEYFVDSGARGVPGLFDPADWIMRHNEIQIDSDGSPNGMVDYWTTTWDPAGLEDGQYLVRAVATDRTGTTDDGSLPCDPEVEPIPVTTYEIDMAPPTVDIVKIVVPSEDGQIEIPFIPGDMIEVSGGTPYFQIVAETPDLDVIQMVFEWSLDGFDWSPLRWRDGEFYSDLNGEPGYQDGCDERFVDIDGDFHYTDGVDYILDDNGDGVDTPDGELLYPYLEMGDPTVVPNEPWMVFVIPADPDVGLGLEMSANVSFRVTATDDMGLTGEDQEHVIINDPLGPEADIPIGGVVTDTGVIVDVFVSDEDPEVDTVPADAESLLILVTTEPNASVAYVDLLYRPYDCLGESGSCPADEFMSASEAGMLEVDDTYPFNLAWDITGLEDGSYEFYPEAVEHDGSRTVQPALPYRFGIFRHEMDNFAYVYVPESGTEKAEGDTLTIKARLMDEDYVDMVAVRFWFAPRILGEVISVESIPPSAPYTVELDHAVLQPGYGQNIVVTINGDVATYGEDYTVSVDELTFTVRPDPDDVVLVDYNFDEWRIIGIGDDYDPYSVEWSEEDGGIPDREDIGAYDAHAYDLVAQALFDLNGDGEYEGECDNEEFAAASEGTYIILLDVERPKLVLYGLTRDDRIPDYPDFNKPGNPVFRSVAGNVENKLSGVETDLFLVADDDADTAWVVIDPDVPGASEIVLPLTEISAIQDYVMLPVTFYPWDVNLISPNGVVLRPTDIENVILEVLSPESFTREMTLQEDGTWYVEANFPVDAQSEYQFIVDLIGDEQFPIPDPRNNDGDPAEAFPTFLDPEAESVIDVPDVSFWYGALDMSLLSANAVHRAVAHARDADMNEGTNLNSDMPFPIPNMGEEVYEPQGPIVFIYDTTAPETQSLYAETPITNPDADPDTVWAEVTDVTEGPDEVTVAAVSFQYGVGGGVDEVDWVEFDRDTDPSDGWSGMFDPSIAPHGVETLYSIRTQDFDDGMNSSKSDALETILVDGIPPTVTMDSPSDGDWFLIGSEVPLAATADDGAGEIAYVQFQYMDGRHAWQDTNDDGHYTHGVDAVWAESDPTQEPPWFDDEDDVAVWGDPDTKEDGFWWFDIDATPEDNGDDPWFASSNPSMNWNSSELWFTEGDTYVHLGAKAKDVAGNEAHAYVVTIAADQMGPKAYIGWINDETIGAGEKKAVTGTVMVYGKVLDHENTAFVTLKYQVPGSEDWQTIGVDPSPYNGDPPGDDAEDDGTHFVVEWNTDLVDEGEWDLAAFATDVDGNEDDSPLVILVVVDRTPPVANYTPISPDYDGFTTTAEYFGGMVILPDPDTGDVFFVVTTTSDDVETVDLQWRYQADPAGLWRPDGGEDGLLSDPGMFDYEPNLNFMDGDDMHHVWRYHVEDWAMNVMVDGGPAHFRALMTDEAGNTNALQLGVDLTIDTDIPYVWNWEDDVPTDQVSVGDVVTFTISFKDTTTSVVQAHLESRIKDSGDDWAPVGVLDLEGVGEGGPNAQWVGTVEWTAPMVYMDTDYEFQAVAYDAALNMGVLGHPDPGFVITVEDDIAPDNTKIFHVAAEVWFIDDPDDPADDDPFDPFDPLANDNAFLDIDNNGIFNAGTDYVVSEGEEQNDGFDGVAGQASVGADDNTWPRFLDESFLTAGLEVGKVAREVVLVARTWADDESIDDGLAHVAFKVRQGEQEWIIGKDEYPPFFPLFTWHVVWNTMELDGDGNRVYPDGLYEVAAYALDQSGNEEDQTDLEWVEVYVDNTGPEATMVDGEDTVERNSVFTLLATTESDEEDDYVEFWYKRSRDQNVEDSWRSIWSEWDVDFPNSDGNPDSTRPFSFDLNLTEVWDPVEDGSPLVVGESYDFAGAASDIMGNMDSHISAFGDDRHITLTIVDNIAPVACITALERNLGNTDRIENPDYVHAASLEYLEAVNFANDADIDYVEFFYRKVDSGDNWTLIDIDVIELGDEPNPTYRIGPWDLQALEHNEWYEVVSVATDDVGNSDWLNGEPVGCEPIHIYVDYSAPELAWYHPTSQATTICDYETVDDKKVLDVCVVDTTGTGDPEATNDVDIDGIVWQWKKTIEAESAYDDHGGQGFSGSTLHDDILNTYCTTWVLCDEYDNLGDGFCLDTGLYDIRVKLPDVAGNVAVAELKGLVYDAEDPYPVAITNIVDVDDDPTQNDVDDGQVTEIEEGMSVKVYATASDDEDNLPRGRETQIVEISFRVSPEKGSWRDLGTIQFDPEDHGDDTDVEAYVVWNTTGLSEGTYYLQARALDECGNEGWSTTADVRISDTEPPTARIACFDVDLELHGNDPKTFVWIYAIAESDPNIVDVLFQYDIVDDEPDEGWVNIGIGEEVEADGNDQTQALWRTRIESSAFEDSTQMVMRALAKDSDGNRYGDRPGEPVPELTVMVVERPDGSFVFEGIMPPTDILVNAELIAVPEYYDEALLIVTATMSVQDQVPRLVFVGDDFDNEGDSFEIMVMTRSVDDPFVWRSYVDIYDVIDTDEDCGTLVYCVTALDENLQVDGVHGEVVIAPVTDELGTNGTLTLHSAEGDPLVSAHIPTGADEEGCLLLAPGEPLNLSHDQDMYVSVVEGATYVVQLLDSSSDFEPGYEAHVCIWYDEDAVAEAQGGTLNENLITVRRWDEADGITSATISDVTVFPEENKVCFNASQLHYDDDEMPLFSVVVGDDQAPVFVAAMCPTSPYPGRFNYTDDDPQWLIFLRGMGEEIDIETVEIMMTMGPDEDHQEWVTVASDEFVLGDYECDGYVDWERINDEGTLYYVTYNHPHCDPFELSEGVHEFNVRFRTEDGTWFELQGSGSPFEEFHVDNTPPEILFASGFVQNPRLRNVVGYFNPWAEDAQEMLTAWVVDHRSGVMFRNSDENQCHDESHGFYYDLWLIDREDEQNDIDEFEERMLLHTGTPGELTPFLDPPLGEYSPGTDTLMVRLPIVGDSIIKDGDVIEVTIYSEKIIEANSDYETGECTADSIIIGDDTIIVVGGNCHWDEYGQEMHIYTEGVNDWAGNEGEHFIEARFVVDLTCPSATFNMAGRFDPDDGIWIDACLDDSGSGVGSASCKLIGPDGEQIETEGLITIEDDCITGHVEGPLPIGEYTLVCDITDRVGNSCVIQHPINVETAILTMTGAYSYPNPFDPAEANATIHFTLSKSADVTVKVYDFAGDYVTTLASRQPFDAGEHTAIQWGGEAADGTDLANGAYICRIAATDGARTEEANVKVVIWRE